MTWAAKNLAVCFSLIFAGCLNLLVFLLMALNNSHGFKHFGLLSIVVIAICFYAAYCFYSRFRVLHQQAVEEFMALAKKLKVAPEELEASETKIRPGIYQFGGVYYCIGVKPIPCNLNWRHHMGLRTPEESRLGVYVWIGTASASDIDRRC